MFYHTPLAAFCTYCVGQMMRIPIPRFLRPLVYARFARYFGISVEEAEYSFTSYRTLDAFFTRALKPSCRPISFDPHHVVSPVDGKLIAFGKIVEGQLIQAKGLHYSVEALTQQNTVTFDSGFFATFYLSPSDCHRVFSPLFARLDVATWIPGALLPVREPYISQYSGLYSKNERVVMSFSSQKGQMDMVMVGAFNVAHVSFCDVIDAPFIFRGPGRSKRSAVIEKDVKVGEWVSTFHLGSTVILLFENTGISFDSLALGKHYKYGEKIGSF